MNYCSTQVNFEHGKVKRSLKPQRHYKSHYRRPFLSGRCNQSERFIKSYLMHFKVVAGSFCRLPAPFVCNLASCVDQCLSPSHRLWVVSELGAHGGYSRLRWVHANQHQGQVVGARERRTAQLGEGFIFIFFETINVIKVDKPNLMKEWLKQKPHYCKHGGNFSHQPRVIRLLETLHKSLDGYLTR